MPYMDLILHHHLHSRPLGRAHAVPSIPASWKCFFVRVFITVRISAWISTAVSNLHSFSLSFILGKWKKSDGASDNIWKKLWIVLKLLLKFHADFQAFLLLFILQQSWHKLRHNLPHVQFLCQNSLTCTITYSQGVTEVLDGQSAISQNQIPNFYDIFLCDASWRLSRRIINISRCSGIFEMLIPIISFSLA
jgi:hypothetical protein